MAYSHSGDTKNMGDTATVRFTEKIDGLKESRLPDSYEIIDDIVKGQTYYIKVVAKFADAAVANGFVSHLLSKTVEVKF